ncbi:MAG: hypothetical protein ABFS37_05360 [Acidobacteriota bacterium]
MAGPLHDLGHGVRVEGGSANGPVVTSTEVILPWRPRAGLFVGTAVTWCDQLFEARSVERNDGGERWQLALWPEGEAARNTDRLDAGRIETLAGEAAEFKKSRGIRFVLVLLSPLAGLMPGPVQRRWEREHNFPGARATILSAVTEMGLGMWWIVHPGPVLLRFFGWMLFAEAMVRLWCGLNHDEPMGSFLTAPFGWVTALLSNEPAEEGRRIEVVRWAEGDPEMALAMPDPRVDWMVDGIIRFRGSLWRLIEKELGRGLAVYHFEAVPPDTPVTLSLAPPPRQEKHRDRGRGLVADAGRFVLLSFAPQRFQEQLTPDLNLGVRTLTWISAAVELFGGTVNLLGPAPRDALVGLDLLFVIEGAFRLIKTAVTGLPAGSLLGLPFINVYERWVRFETDPP